MKTQKESVYQVIVALFGHDGGEFKPSKENIKEICNLVTEDIVSGNVSFSDDAKLKYPTPTDIRTKYVPGMVSNWLRKDTRLNGGEKYETKNPGSRAGQGDEVLKSLKGLKQLHPEHAAEIDLEIAKRVEELGLKKKQQVTIDLDKIPDSLKIQLGLMEAATPVSDEDAEVEENAMDDAV